MKSQDRRKYQDRKKYRGRGNRWTSMAVAGAATLAAALCGGCLYTIVPAMAGQSTTYQQPTDSQPPQPSQTSQASQSSQQSQTSNEQTNQNKQQNGATPNGAQLQGAGGTP